MISTLTQRWLIENHVYYLRHIGDLDPISALTANAICLQILKQAEHKVHFIIDFSVTTDLTINPSRGSRNDEVQQFYTHPNLGWLLFVCQKNAPYYRIVMNMITDSTPALVNWFKNLDDAMEFLQKNDPTIVFE